MRLSELPPGSVRAPRAARTPLFVPPGPAPRRPRAPRSGRLRRWVLRLAAALVLFAAGGGAVGEQGVLASLAGGPAWMTALRAPDPGVALSPHLSLWDGSGVASLTGGRPGWERAPAATRKANPLGTAMLARASAAPSMVRLPSVLARASRSELPRVSFVQPAADGADGDGAGRSAGTAPHRPTVLARAAADSALTAYAPQGGDVEEPFRALFGGAAPAEPRPYGVSGNGKDHWWSDRPLPDTITSKASLKCLAQAIYFEARGESERGQAAVAQVVVNRVKNPAYPDDVCAVVFQNRTWTNRCQFTFACDRIKDVVRDRPAWARAERIARSYAEAKMWLPEIGAATHYHARRVRPKWAALMRPVETIGRHVFYITRNGGWT